MMVAWHGDVQWSRHGAQPGIGDETAIENSTETRRLRRTRYLVVQRLTAAATMVRPHLRVVGGDTFPTRLPSYLVPANLCAGADTEDGMSPTHTTPASVPAATRPPSPARRACGRLAAASR